MINEGHLKGTSSEMSSWVVLKKVDPLNSKRVGGVIKITLIETSPKRMALLAHLRTASTIMAGGLVLNETTVCASF